MSDEYLDIVNEQDVTIGKETRKKVHEIGLWHRGAHVFLFDKDGKMLIQKRNASRASNPLRLDCSVSEHVLAGESYAEAAIRGLKEELGIENVELKQLVKFRMNYGINDNEISVIYEGKIDSQQIDFDKNEVEEVFYMSMDEIKEKSQNEKNLFCDWFVQMMNWYFERETRLIVMD
ncbi:MAG: NUDIX domain-containing protein [Anaerolineales bacterium]|nr:NUDIX domain-containing protein [Anaerolineales bacterium]